MHMAPQPSATNILMSTPGMGQDKAPEMLALGG